jgi:hypothetical protein
MAYLIDTKVLITAKKFPYGARLLGGVLEGGYRACRQANCPPRYYLSGKAMAAYWSAAVM